ncbi:TolB family protein [Catellatospora aurea]|uniref:TolB family protein n=1 Tax=Catellatospora aurea TaxID=1337874 RepID=A0ABW2H8S7_9ACTN
MNAPMDNLRSGLADLADDVNPVDLRDRALRTSRRIGVRRTALTSALSLVLLAGAGVTAVAMTGGGGGVVEPGASTTATVAPVSPSPVRATVTGDYYFMGQTSNTKLQLSVLRESYPCGTPEPGACKPVTRTEQLRTITHPTDDACPWQSVTVSPDGRRVAWVVGADGVSSGGDLMIADTRGGTPQKRGSGVLCLGTGNVVWSPDSTRLYVGKLDNAGTVGVVDAGSGKFSPMEREAWKEAQSLATGPFRGVLGDGRLTVTKADGTAPRSVPYETEHGLSAVVLGVSHDGRYAAVSTEAGDPSRRLYVADVIDLTSGQPVAFGVGKVSAVWFQPDGSLVVQVNGDPDKVYRLDADLRVVAEFTVDKAQFRNRTLFQGVIG